MRDANAVLEGCGRLVVRYSGTEPLLRVMIESDDAERNEEWMKKLLRAIDEDIKNLRLTPLDCDAYDLLDVLSDLSVAEGVRKEIRQVLAGGFFDAKKHSLRPESQSSLKIESVRKRYEFEYSVHKREQIKLSSLLESLILAQNQRWRRA